MTPANKDFIIGLLKLHPEKLEMGASFSTGESI